MIPELGHIALIFTLIIATVQVISVLYGVSVKKSDLLQLSLPLTVAQTLFIALSYIALTIAFIQNDFTVQYVASHSNSLLPIQYKITAVWGGHEGSILLWILILSLWALFVALRCRQLPEKIYSLLLAILSAINIGFLSFSLFTSNPFTRFLPDFPLDGQDLNPLLQDIGLIIHPPTLYLGYVGFSVPFAFAILALIYDGDKSFKWASLARTWALSAWAFLTLGIALGSWWAYYELGWGGWWFWDPVENASFMPWLIGTALVHSLMLVERRQVKPGWAILLAITAFVLSLLGTFLVRSGVLTSVHAFASDPERGLFILLFLVLTIALSMVFYFMRVGYLKEQKHFEILSKESLLLLQSLLFITATFIVFLGTLYPLFVDVLGLGKLSVGPPYFNSLFVPLVFILALSLGLSLHLKWGRKYEGDAKTYLKKVGWHLMGAAMIAAFISFMLFNTIYATVFISIVLAFFIILSQWSEIVKRLKNNQRVSAQYLGSVFAHVGFVITIIGIAVSSFYSIEKDARLEPGQSIQLAGYDFKFDRLEYQNGPNYSAAVAFITVTQDGETIAKLLPEKRSYAVQTSVMTEAAIDPALTRDLYVVLGDALPNNGWAFRIYYKPLIRWIWLGALFMALGAFVTCVFSRRRQSSSITQKEVGEREISSTQMA